MVTSLALKIQVLLILFHCCAEFSSFVWLLSDPFSHWLIATSFKIDDGSIHFSNLFCVGAFAKTCSLLSLGRGHYDAVSCVHGKCGVVLSLLIRTNNIDFIEKCSHGLPEPRT